MLTSEALTEPDLDRAVDELLMNAAQLAAAGFADIAIGALALLIENGPWRLPRHGGLRKRYERLLRPVYLLAGVDCPATDGRAAMAAPSLRQWAADQAEQELRMLSMPDRVQIAPVGTEWSAEYLASLPACTGDKSDPQPHVRFGRFCADAEMLLKSRLAAHFGTNLSVRDMLPDNIANLGIDLTRLPGYSSDIEIAPGANAIDTLEIVRAAAQYLHVTGFAGGYMEPIFACAWVVLVDQGRSDAAAEVARNWVRQDSQATMRMVDLSVVPSIAAFLRSGKLASTIGVDRLAGETWLSRLAERPTRATAPLPAHFSKKAVGARSKNELLSALKGCPLADLNWHRVAIADTAEHAWVASLCGATPIKSWKMARDRLADTGRWPLLTTSWSGEVKSETLSDDLFSRWSYEKGPSSNDVSPAGIISRAGTVDLQLFLSELRRDWETIEDEDVLDVCRSELQRAGAIVDDIAAIWIKCGKDRIRFERVLADKERAQGVADPEMGRQDIFEPDETLLALLPTSNGAESLAYMHWYGMERGRPEAFVRLVDRWSERFGAELYAHYGTMLEFNVTRPPVDIDTAFDLAVEHETVAPCTLILPGIPLRHYAEGLIGHQTWFLHERP